MTVPYTDANTVIFLKTADEIGRRISHEAVWYQDRCNWLGADPVERNRIYGQFGMTYRALEPGLYAGTSGIALFPNRSVLPSSETCAGK